MTEADRYKKAIAVVTEAVENDHAENYKVAYEKYGQCLDMFIKAVKDETNEEVKKRIHKMIGEYFDRAEILKKELFSQESKAKGASGKNNATAGSKANKSGSDKNEESEDDSDMKKIRANLSSAILQEKPNVRWSDIAGLEGAKEALKEAVILPIKFPHLFTGMRRPWRGILLYGPPGTGKSYLAKAVATEANSTFFSISSSDLVSKWLGESERAVRQLFQMARENKPAIVFIDEIDSLCGARGEGESEASRRIKTEILVQMNGVGNDMDGVLVLGATNIPWDLDSAIRRRFERRIYIPLPEKNALVKMFELNVGNTHCTLNKEDYVKLAGLTEGYSGSDIAVLVRDALMEPIRKVQQATHFELVTLSGTTSPDGVTSKYTPCSPGVPNAKEMTWMNIEPHELLEPDLTLKDFEKAVKKSRPTVSAGDIEKHILFTKDFGQEG